MKLDRNTNKDGAGKYALVRLRGTLSEDAKYALALLQEEGVLDWGRRGDDDEFFVIRLKDKYAADALASYARAARKDDAEWANEVDALAARSGPNHPLCKRPD
jgi:hypothetical protein